MSAKEIMLSEAWKVFAITFLRPNREMTHMEWKAVQMLERAVRDTLGDEFPKDLMGDNVLYSEANA